MLVHLDGQVIAFSPNQTNVDGPITLNVDSLGAFPLQSAPGVNLVAGTLVVGTPYTALFNNTAGAFYLQGFYSNPYQIPLLAGMDFWGTIAPNSRFIFPAGQAISRTVYSAAFAIWGTTFGVGDGSTTFNVPDKTGRVSAMIESAATRLTSTYFGGNSTLLGQTGNSSEHSTLVTANLPPYTPSGGVASSSSLSNVLFTNGTVDVSTSGSAAYQPSGYANITITSTFTGSAQGGTSTPVRTVPPLITCNYIIRIL